MPHTTEDNDSLLEKYTQSAQYLKDENVPKLPENRSDQFDENVNFSDYEEYTESEHSFVEDESNEEDQWSIDENENSCENEVLNETDFYNDHPDEEYQVRNYHEVIIKYQELNMHDVNADKNMKVYWQRWS